MEIKSIERINKELKLNKGCITRIANANEMKAIKDAQTKINESSKVKVEIREGIDIKATYLLNAEISEYAKKLKAKKTTKIEVKESIKAEEAIELNEALFKKVDNTVSTWMNKIEKIQDDKEREKVTQAVKDSLKKEIENEGLMNPLGTISYASDFDTRVKANEQGDLLLPCTRRR